MAHDIPDPIAWETGIGTTFYASDQTIIIEDDDLSEALKHLPDDYREIILRYYMLKQTETQIGMHLFINQRTVSYKKNKALKLIQKWMGKSYE